MSNNAFTIMMKSSRKLREPAPSPNKRMKSGSAYWKNSLKQALHDSNNIIDSSDSLVIIKDKFPKAKFHYLFLPKVLELNSPKELTKVHLNILKEMKQKASDFLEQHHPNIDFKIGFHAIPSMDHLHLHVISTDFISLHLKTKKHWNSYNTKFFLNLSVLIEQLEGSRGQLEDYPTDEDIESYLKTPLTCNQCPFHAKNMPSLKVHLAGHASI